MSRRTWVYRDGVAIEVTPGFQPEARGPSLKSEEEIYGHVVMPDGTVTNSRAKYNAYLTRNNLAPMDDFKAHWERAEAQREAARTPGAGFDRERRTAAVADAVKMLEARYGPGFKRYRGKP